MSEILEFVLEFLFDCAGYLLEAMLDIWLGDLSWPDSRGAQIFWCGVIVLLGVLIWRELH